MKKGFSVYMLTLLLLGIFALVSTPALAQITVNCPTQSLQTAINNASAGQTITVKGTCKENVKITKNDLIIDGKGTGAIAAPNSTTANAITLHGDGNTLKGLHISGGYAGVAVGVGMHTLSGNAFTGSGQIGILVINSGTALIIGNTVANQPAHGIVVADGGTARIGFSAGWDTVAVPNTISSNKGAGIMVTRGGFARIVGNTITGNTMGGIIVGRVSHADIANNEINNNQGDGITVHSNSGINLGADTGTDIFSLPNTTNAKAPNAKAGIGCGINSYVDGRKGTLTGKTGVISVAPNCVNDTI